MKTTIQKIQSQFTASMILESNIETISEDNLKLINTYFINEFIEEEKFLDENKVKADLEKRKPLLIGFAIASGDDRAEKAIELALFPLLFNDKLKENSKYKSVLLLISSQTIEINIDEVGLIND